MLPEMVKSDSSKARDRYVLYGLLSGLGLILFFITFVSVFQGFKSAILSFLSLKYWLLPLAAGFGIQVGLFSSIKHTMETNAALAGSGTLSAGSMVACCAHFLVNIIPIMGIAGLAAFLLRYQTTFLGIGIMSNVAGIVVMLRHKIRIKRKMKGGLCH